MRPSNLLCASFLICCATRVEAATFVVDTTSDAVLTACGAAAADCSLRGAMASANLTAGADLIQFGIPTSEPGCVATTGVCTIQPGSQLPTIYDGDGDSPVVFDATTQPGWSPTTLTPAQGGLDAQLKIELNGMNCPSCSGLGLAEPGSVVRGIAIHSFRVDIVVDTAHNSAIEGNFIGTDATGTRAPAPTGDVGILIGGNPTGGEGASASVRIGGTQPAQRNLISGHSGSDGMQLRGYNIQVLGNLIGTNAAGTAALGNRTGVHIDGGGSAAFPFQFVIGNGTPEGRNVISGNGLEGVFAGAALTRDSRIQGNYIGTDVTGELLVGNGTAGINTALEVDAADPSFAVQIGGLAAGQGNRVRFNGAAGISAGRMKSPVRGNQMGRNGALGINNTGVRNPNDAGDADGFFSALQNFPEISEFSTNGTSFDLSYRVDSTSGNSAYPMRVEFFKADRDEGRDFLAADNYLAGEAQTFKAVTLSVPAGVTLSADDVILATATDGAGNTSEFTFYPSTLAIQTPVKSACTTADALHCDGFDAGALPSLLARVSAIADSGPFAPRGDVVVTDSRGASCTVTLNPTATPLTSEGTCTLVNSGAAGPITLNATLDTLLSAFAAASGGNASASASFVVP